MTGYAVTEVLDVSFSVEWDEMAGATYNIMYYPEDDPPAKIVVTGLTDPEYQAVGLQPATKYIFEVAADVAGDTGPPISNDITTGQSHFRTNHCLCRRRSVHRSTAPRKFLTI